MLRFQFTLAALVAAAALLVAPATSRADFILTLTDGSGNILEISSAVASNISAVVGTGSPTTVGGFQITTPLGPYVTQYQATVTFDGYTVGITGSSNTPGVSSGIISNATLTFNGTGTVPVTVTTQSNGFSSPVAGPATLSTVLSSSQLPGGSLTGSSEVLNGSTVVGATAPIVLNMSNTGTAVGQQPGTGSISNKTALNIPSPYSIENSVIVTGLPSLGEDSFTITSTVSTAAPAPPGLVMLAGALPFAGLLRLRRFRKSEVATVA
jgi:hypothetical protein